MIQLILIIFLPYLAIIIYTLTITKSRLKYVPAGIFLFITLIGKSSTFFYPCKGQGEDCFGHAIAEALTALLFYIFLLSVITILVSPFIERHKRVMKKIFLTSMGVVALILYLMFTCNFPLAQNDCYYKKSIREPNSSLCKEIVGDNELKNKCFEVAKIKETTAILNESPLKNLKKLLKKCEEIPFDFQVSSKISKKGLCYTVLVKSYRHIAKGHLSYTFPCQSSGIGDKQKESELIGCILEFSKDINKTGDFIKKCLKIRGYGNKKTCYQNVRYLVSRDIVKNCEGEVKIEKGRNFNIIDQIVSDSAKEKLFFNCLIKSL